jgi:hypothetical protein
VPDPDRPDPEVIDFSPKPARTRLFIAIAAAAVIGVVAAVVFVVINFGNRYALTGSSFSPGVLEHESWSQIAAALKNPHSTTGWSILGTVNYITAAICQLTHDQPATACTPAVRSLLPGG